MVFDNIEEPRLNLTPVQIIFQSKALGTGYDTTAV